MKHLVWLSLPLMIVSGCRTRPPEPIQKITPGARIIYDSGTGNALWAICDKGNLVYMAALSPNISVVPDGCPTGSP